jgi:hypothetical protein
VPLGGLNPIELAALQGHHKLLAYFFDDLGVRSMKDLKIAPLIDDMLFIVAPIFKRDKEIVRLILE